MEVVFGVAVVVDKLKGLAEGMLFNVVVSGTAAVVTAAVVGSATLVVISGIVVDTGTLFSSLAVDVVGAVVVVVGGTVVLSVVCAGLREGYIKLASDANDSCILELSVGKILEGRRGDVYNICAVVVGTVVVSIMVCVANVVTLVTLTGTVVDVAVVPVFAFAGGTVLGTVVVGTDVVVSVVLVDSSETDEMGESTKLSYGVPVTNVVIFGVTSTNSVGSGLGVEVRELRSANSFPMVRCCKVCSEDISSSTLKGF